MHTTGHAVEASRDTSSSCARTSTSVACCTASLPKLHATEPSCVSPLAKLASSDSDRYYAGPLSTPRSADTSATTRNTMKPAADWSHPLDALQRYKESAWLAYTPFTVAAAEVVAARQAEAAAQQLFPRIEDGSAGLHHSYLNETAEVLRSLLPPPLPSTTTTSVPALLPALRRQLSADPRRTAQTVPATISLSLSNNCSLPRTPLLGNSSSGGTVGAAASLLAPCGATARPPLMALRRRPSSSIKREAAAHKRLGSAAKGHALLPLIETSALPSKLSLTEISEKSDSIITEHYAHLARLLHGYSDEEVAGLLAEDKTETPTTCIQRKPSFQSPDFPAKLAAGLASATAIPTVTSGVARTFSTAQSRTPLLSSSASACTASHNDDFWYFVMQHRLPSLHATPLAKGDVTHLQRYLQHCFDRQLRSLFQYEESERAQLQLDGFRALHTLYGLHDRYRDYVELRTRQAAVAAEMDVQAIALKDVYLGPSLLLPLRATECERAHLEGEASANVATTLGVFEELEMSAGTRGKAFAARRQAEEEELKADDRETSTHVAAMQEACEELIPTLDVDLLEASLPTHAKVASPVGPFEELHMGHDTHDGAAALQESLEELVSLTRSGASKETDIEAVTEAASQEKSPPYVNVRRGEVAPSHKAFENLIVLDAPEQEEEEKGKLIFCGLQDEAKPPSLFEELEDAEVTRDIVPPSPPKPFEELLEHRSTPSEVAALQEVYEELAVPVPVASASMGHFDLPASPAKQPSVELGADTRARTASTVSSTSVEELEVSVSTDVAATALKEVCEEVVLSVKHAEQYMGVETVRADAVYSSTVAEHAEDDPTAPEVHESRKKPGSAAASSAPSPASQCTSEASAVVVLPPNPYNVGAPEVITDTDGKVREVTCRFNDLTLDGFAANDVGDVFAEACGGLHRPVVVSCERRLGGTNWCAHLLSAGVVMWDCVVADVCAALECAAVRVRNVTLVATAATAKAAGEEEVEVEEGLGEMTNDDFNESDGGSNVGEKPGLTVRMDVIHEAIFAPYPEEEVAYLIRECRFPFLQQWCRSQAALLRLARRRRSSTSTNAATDTQVSHLNPDGVAVSSRGVAIPLWAYTTETARRPCHSAPKLHAARLSASPVFDIAASNLSIGVSNRSGTDPAAAVVVAAPGAATEVAHTSADILSSLQQPVSSVSTNTRTELVSSVKTDDDSLVMKNEGVSAGTQGGG